MKKFLDRLYLDLESIIEDVFEEFKLEMVILYFSGVTTLVIKIWIRLKIYTLIRMRPRSIQTVYKWSLSITLFIITRIILSVWITSRTKGKEYYHAPSNKVVTIEHSRILIAFARESDSQYHLGIKDIYFRPLLTPLSKVDLKNKEN